MALETRMGVWKFYFRAGLSLCVVISSLIFLLYPAWVTLRVALDSGFGKPGINSYTLSMFEQVSHRYNKWGNHYLKSQYASKVSWESVAGTEWPIFGSVFYLATAEEILHQLEGKKNWQARRLRKEILKTSEVAARIVADPSTATWVKQQWGENYLTKENVFYRMLLIMGLTHYEHITGKLTYRPLLGSQVQTLGKELSEAPYPLLDDYPGDCYPNDVLWAVAALRRADPLLGTDHQKLGDDLMKVLNTKTLAKEGLPTFMAIKFTGEGHDLSRGCGNSGILIYAPELDRGISHRWYQNYEKHFWQDNGWIRGFREYSKGIPYSNNDVDSGPVMGGFGSVATVIGIGAARANGRLDHASVLTRQIIPASWPTPWGLMIPSLMGGLMIDAAPLGEMALLFSMTRPVPSRDVVSSPWTLPWGIILIFFIFLLPGLYLIYTEYRYWKKWLKPMGQSAERPEANPDTQPDTGEIE